MSLLSIFPRKIEDIFANSVSNVSEIVESTSYVIAVLKLLSGVLVSPLIIPIGWTYLTRFFSHFLLVFRLNKYLFFVSVNCIWAYFFPRSFIFFSRSFIHFLWIFFVGLTIFLGRRRIEISIGTDLAGNFLDWARNHIYSDQVTSVKTNILPISFDIQCEQTSDQVNL